LVLDLDSIASALSFAYLSKQNSTNDDLYLPLVNIAKEDLALRPEAGYVLAEASIDPQYLCYNDTLDINILADVFRQVKLILVDHNKLTYPFTMEEHKWASRVSGILDHHIDEHLYDCDLFREIKPVGSCSSLTVLHHREILERDSSPELQALAKLILAPLLVDSVNLQPQYGRTTEDDKTAASILKRHVSIDNEKYFDAIQEAKTKIHHLNNRDLFRKDYKEWRTNNGFKVGISHVPWYFEAWANREHSMNSIVDSMHDWAKNRQLDLSFIMTSMDRKEEGGYQRELLAIVYNEQLTNILQQMADNNDIQLEPLSGETYNGTSNQPLRVWRQLNTNWSRKQVWPFVKSLVEAVAHNSS
jgi:exopolyphosphatase